MEKVWIIDYYDFRNYIIRKKAIIEKDRMYYVSEKIENETDKKYIIVKGSYSQLNDKIAELESRNFWIYNISEL